MSRGYANASDTILKKRPREKDVTSPDLPRKSRKLSAEVSPALEDTAQNERSVRFPNKHTKKERKQNRSTRIHSLRKQLARGTLPATIRQDKERELAALVHEQNKTALKKQARKTIEKYHYVRFLERRRAEKKLKQLQRRQAASGDSDDADLSKQIHEMEVNLNYAIYAPLGQKYISVFVPETEKEQAEDGRRPKPPMWYAVEKAMLGGKAELEALRDSKTTLDLATDDLDGGKLGDVGTASTQNSSERRKNATRTQAHRDQSDDHAFEELETASEDGAADGGFFER